MPSTLEAARSSERLRTRRRRDSAFNNRDARARPVGRLDGRVALVSGGSGGIGRATALELAREGADVVVQYRTNRAPAEDVVRAIGASGRKGLDISADVSDREACFAL